MTTGGSGLDRFRLSAIRESCMAEYDMYMLRRKLCDRLERIELEAVQSLNPVEYCMYVSGVDITLDILSDITGINFFENYNRIKVNPNG